MPADQGLEGGLVPPGDEQRQQLPVGLSAPLPCQGRPVELVDATMDSLLTAGLGLDAESSLVAVVAALVVGGGIFATVASRMRIRELAELTAIVRNRLRSG